LRFATAFGLSPRMRFDLSVSDFAHQIYFKKKMDVYDPQTWRPYCHVEDISRAIIKVISSKESKIKNQIFNVGYENMSIMNLAELVQLTFKERYSKDIEIVKTESNDNRSYHINSDKISEVLGFKPQKTIEYGIGEICDAFKNGSYQDSFENINYYNVKKLKLLDAK